MLKEKKNSFEKICDKLEENNILGENEITYVRKYFTYDLKISEDKDMLLKLKAEAEDLNYNTFITSIINLLAMFFAALAVIINLLPEVSEMSQMSLIINLVKIVYLLIIIVVILIPVKKIFNGKLGSAKKWREYVLVVINELIEIQSEKIEQDFKTEQRENQNVTAKIVNSTGK